LKLSDLELERMTDELTTDNLQPNVLGADLPPRLVCPPRPGTDCHRAYLAAGQAAARRRRQQ
jgi:hypothetical protein